LVRGLGFSRVYWLRFSTASKKTVPASLEIPPKTHRPSTTPLYLRCPILFSSISTVEPTPPITFLAISDQLMPIYRRKLFQSTTVCWDQPSSFCRKLLVDPFIFHVTKLHACPLSKSEIFWRRSVSGITNRTLSKNSIKLNNSYYNAALQFSCFIPLQRV